VLLQVLFHAASSKLITASEDGLVAVHDVSGGLNQDDGFIAALNVGTSVEQLGLYGSQGQHMWCRWVVLGGVMLGVQDCGCFDAGPQLAEDVQHGYGLALVEWGLSGSFGDQCVTRSS
jgi:hypothetical protein